MLSGSSHPTPSRRHRSSSSLSTRSINPNAATGSGMSGSIVGTSLGISNNTFSGITPIRDGTLPPQARDTISRQNSVASSRRSEVSSPSLSSSMIQSDHLPTTIPHRQSTSSQHSLIHTSLSSQSISPNDTRSPTRIPAVVSARYEEVTHHRLELEAAKRENEALRRRIQELERSLRTHRHSSDST